jgi:hypothetical protein
VTVLVLVGLSLILALEAESRRRSAASALCAALLAAYLAILLLPSARHFFALTAPRPAVLLPALLGAAIAAAGLATVDNRFIPYVHSGSPVDAA